MRRSLKPLVTVALGALLVSALLHAGPPAAQTGQQAKTFEKTITIKLDYLLYIPDDYNKDTQKQWPLMLFLHGSGERGSDINRVKVHGPPKVVANGKALPFIIVSPQCPAGAQWDPQQLVALLDDIQAKYRVDPDRVYLTGLSMGGFGTWETAQRYPTRFAAIVPICGGGNPGRAIALRNVPVWIFHGEADPTVPIAQSEAMYDALKKINADVQFTHYPGVGHDSWTRTYDNPELYTWLLSHKRVIAPARSAPATRPAR